MIIDIVLILVIVLSAFIGYKKGFVKVIVKLGTFLIALVLAFLLQSSVAKFIGEDIGFKNTISTTVQNKLSDYAKSKEDDKKTDIKMLEKTIDEINSAAEEKKAEVIQKWANNIADFILKGLSFIIIFFTVAIVMGILSLILNTVIKLPVLDTLNGVLGLGAAVILMAVRIMILLTIIYFVSPLEIIQPVINYINTSCITKLLYENNIIVNILGRKLM